MSLDVKKLERARELAGGVTQARCPACAEGGGDKKGEHLRIYPDGRYGCCVHPKDAQHRKRIFALAGARPTGATRGEFTVRVAVAAKPEAGRSVRANLAGALRECGRQNAECGMEGTEGGEGVGTLRTGAGTSANEPSCCEAEGQTNVRTLRTPVSNPRAYAREGSDDAYIYKDWKRGVLSVLEPEPATATAAAEARRQRLPFFTADGALSIPFDSPERYHWWKPDGERLTVKEIRTEVRGRMEEEKNGAAF